MYPEMHAKYRKKALKMLGELRRLKQNGSTFSTTNQENGIEYEKQLAK